MYAYDSYRDKWLVWVMFFSVLCVGTSAWAREGRRPAEGKRGRKTRFDEDDRNNDGRISAREFSGPKRAFQKIDANGDGYISRKESREAGRDRAGGRSRMPAAASYDKLEVLVLKKEKVWPHNALFVDGEARTVVEIDLNGKVLWKIDVPRSCEEDAEAGANQCGNRISDVELLPNNHVLVMAGGCGVYELNRRGEVVWEYLNRTVSHDADRLENGNTIMACSIAEQVSKFPYKDPQAIEVNQEGEIVWTWYAKQQYAKSKYRDHRAPDANDWTHVNSVQRLADGNTLLSVRNWNLLVVADAEGATAWETGGYDSMFRGWGASSPHCPHTPVLLDNGNIIVSEPIKGRVVEWSPKQKRVVWAWPDPNWEEGGTYYFVRAAHRLPNGNTFVIDSLGQLIEVTPKGEIVWQVRHPGFVKKTSGGRDGKAGDRGGPQGPFFNADRRGLGYYGGR